MSTIGQRRVSRSPMATIAAGCALLMAWGAQSPVSATVSQGEPPVIRSAITVHGVGSKPVGVGQLVSIKLPTPVPQENRETIESHLAISSTKTLPPGSWGWVNSTTIVYRPKAFWPANTEIAVSVDLAGVPLADTPHATVVGDEQATRSLTLKTGRSLVMTVDSRKHRLTVVENGRTVKRMPVSLGDKGWETYSGIKVLTGEKHRSLRMTGNERGDRWDVKSPYSIKLTPDGEYLHGAPWAYHRIGKWNGSHGCTNLFVKDARWLYQRVRAGDPVITRGTGNPMSVHNGTPGSYWNYTWNEWQKR